MIKYIINKFKNKTMCNDAKMKQRIKDAANKYPEFKGLLKELSPESFDFDYKSIKSFEDACNVRCVDINAFYRKFNGFDEDTIAFEKLKIIIKAINNGWRPDWTNKNQPKYYPYFEVQGRSESCNGSRSSGFGFRSTHYDYDYVRTNGGSRLGFETQEQAEYAGKQFVDLYEKYLM